MAISIDWGTQVITVPQADLTFISGTLYELDTDVFRLALKALEAGDEGMVFPDTHRHNTEVTVAGITYARTIEIINGYTVTFEDGQYAVLLSGSNNNLFEEGVINRNQVSVIPTNSAGLIKPLQASDLTAAFATTEAAVERLRKIMGNRAVVAGDDQTVTIYEDDGTTPAFQFTIAADRRERTPV